MTFEKQNLLFKLNSSIMVTFFKPSDWLSDLHCSFYRDSEHNGFSLLKKNNNEVYLDIHCCCLVLQNPCGSFALFSCHVTLVALRIFRILILFLNFSFHTYHHYFICLHVFHESERLSDLFHRLIHTFMTGTYV